MEACNVVVGAVAGVNASGFEEGRFEGYLAIMEFFNNYGFLVLCGQAGLFSFLVFTGKLPGTTKTCQQKLIIIERCDFICGVSVESMLQVFPALRPNTVDDTAPNSILVCGPPIFQCGTA